MTTTTADECPNLIAAELSELLLAWTATGRGINAPSNGTPGMVFTSALPDSVYHSYSAGIAAFNDREALARIPEKEQLEVLEQQLAESKGKRRASADPAVALMLGGTNSEALQRQLKDLREKLAKLPLVAWDDPSATRSTLLDLATTKSLYHTLTIMDSYGSRVGRALCNHLSLSSEAGIAAMTGHMSHNDAFVRSSATGGATIFSTSGTDRPAVNYISRIHSDVADKLAKRIMSKAQAGAMRGRSVIIKHAAPRGYMPKLAAANYDYLSQQVLKLGTKAPCERLTLAYATDEVRAEWEAFLKWDYVEFTAKAHTEFSVRACHKMEASFDTITAFATRAACMQAVLDNCDGSKNLSGKEYLLHGEHLELAKRFAHYLVRHSSALAAMITRSDNAANARSARAPDSSLMVKLSTDLEAAIKASERGMISRKSALSIHGMTPTALDIFAAGVKFQELTGKDTIRMGKTERAYCLKAPLTMDADEAVAELEAVTKEFAEHPERFSPNEALDALSELTKKAEANNTRYVLPCVPIDQMTSEQIRSVPYLLAHYSPYRVILRGTADDPEPKHLTEADTEAADDLWEELVLVPGVANLWFRCDTAMRDFRDWRHSNLGFRDVWHEFREETLGTKFCLPKREEEA